MITTTYQIGVHTVRIHNPAKTPEQKAKQHQRLEKACIRFCENIYKAGGKI